MIKSKKIRPLLIGGLIAGLTSYGVAAQTLSDELAAGETLGLSVAVGGEIAEVLVAPGDQVKHGQLLLRLVDKTYQSRLDAAKSAQDYARFKLQLQEEDYARQQEIYDEGSLSTVELQELDLKVKQTRSELASARAAVNAAAAVLSFSKITAPADGLVIAVPMVGQRVSVDAGLAILIRMKMQGNTQN